MNQNSHISRRRFIRRTVLAAMPLTAGSGIAKALRGRTCEQNLRAIHEAVTVYKRIYDGLPPVLSALVRANLIDPRLLTCPVALKLHRNRLERKDLVNNLGIDSLTLYKWEWVPGDDLTSLHEKQRLIGAGDWTPMVRCDQHKNMDDSGNDHLNLTLGGGIFPSKAFWEYELKELIPFPYLGVIAPNTSGKIVSLRDRIPGRAEGSTVRQVDLGPAFNGSPADSWASGEKHEELLEPLPLDGARGLWTRQGISFEIRGVVQTEGRLAPTLHLTDKDPWFPRRMKPVKAAVTADRLHVLCGVILDQPRGTDAARLTVVEEDGTRIDLILKHGIHVTHEEPLAATEGVSIPWSRDGRERSVYAARCVSHVIWPLGRARRIASLEFAAAEGTSCPFLLAVTAE